MQGWLPMEMMVAPGTPAPHCTILQIFPEVTIMEFTLLLQCHSHSTSCFATGRRTEYFGERLMTPHGMVHWNELNTHNMEKVKEFYAKTLGWTYDSMPGPGGSPYLLCMSEGEMVGGISKISDPRFKDVPEFWMTYFAVDDVDNRVENARDNGATVIMDPLDIPDIGRIAIIQAPGGAVMGWMTPAAADDPA
jgi:uncharacterized protein